MNDTRQTVFMKDPARVEMTLANMKAGGVGKLHVLADFDCTLTTAFVDGKSVPSLISILRDGNYLAPGYAGKAHALYDKYHPIEIDPSISREKKMQAMEKWWREHFALLIASGLSKSDIKHAVESDRARLRNRFASCAEVLKRHGIPLVIMSSGGLGAESIELYLRSRDVFSDNIHIVSNEYEWGEQGNAVGVREPIIHGANKRETIVRDYPVFATIKDRTNVILLGDSIEDLGMVEGFEYENFLTIGFLNERVEERLAEYQKAFDVVLVHDTDMGYVEEVLRKIVE